MNLFFAMNYSRSSHEVQSLCSVVIGQRTLQMSLTLQLACSWPIRASGNRFYSREFLLTARSCSNCQKKNNNIFIRLNSPKTQIISSKSNYVKHDDPVDKMTLPI